MNRNVEWMLMGDVWILKFNAPGLKQAHYLVQAINF